MLTVLRLDGRGRCPLRWITLAFICLLRSSVYGQGSWGEWSTWSMWVCGEDSNSASRTRNRTVCGVENGNSSCTSTDIESQLQTSSTYCSELPDKSSKNTIVTATLAVMAVVIVLCVVLGMVFFYLCWREIKLKRTYRASSQSSGSRLHDHHSRQQPQLLFSGSMEDGEELLEEGTVSVPMQEQSEGIPMHPSSQLWRRDIRASLRRLQMERERKRLGSEKEIACTASLHLNSIHSSSALDDPNYEERGSNESEAGLRGEADDVRAVSERTSVLDSSLSSSRENLLGQAKISKQNGNPSVSSQKSKWRSLNASDTSCEELLSNDSMEDNEIADGCMSETDHNSISWL